MMEIMQSSYCASCGMVDTLRADTETVQQYAGRSALTAIDAIDIEFTRRQIWKPNRTGRDFTLNISLRDRHGKIGSESFFCSSSR
jgi:hypothetical protein